MSHEAVSPGPSAPSSAAGPTAPADLIASGGAHVGLELGSTRIKAALIDEHGTVLATGAHPWENSYIDGNWTYALDEVWQGVQACFTDLAADVRTTHGVEDQVAVHHRRDAEAALPGPIPAGRTPPTPRRPELHGPRTR